MNTVLIENLSTLSFQTPTVYIGQSGSSIFLKTPDGGNSLTISGKTAFNLLQLGGTTNLYPALQPTSSGINVRLADNSAFTNLQAQNVIADNIFEINGATPIQISGSGGNLSIVNNGIYGELNVGSLNVIYPYDTSSFASLNGIGGGASLTSSGQLWIYGNPLVLGNYGQTNWTLDNNGNFVGYLDGAVSIGLSGENRPYNIWASNQISAEYFLGAQYSMEDLYGLNDYNLLTKNTSLKNDLAGRVIEWFPSLMSQSAGNGSVTSNWARNVVLTLNATSGAYAQIIPWGGGADWTPFTPNGTNDAEDILFQDPYSVQVTFSNGFATPTATLRWVLTNSAGLSGSGPPFGLQNKGIGFQVTNASAGLAEVRAYVHNGSSITNQIAGYIPIAHPNQVVMEFDGQGNWSMYANKTLLGQGSGAPTSAAIGSNCHCLVTYFDEVGTTAQSVIIHNIRLMIP